VTSSTPGDGPGQLANILDPALELYGPAQTLLTGGTPLGDDRNEQISYTAPAAGTYYLKVSQAGQTEWAA
jgi:Bacterial pre-peptidase C-terminal domain